MACVLFVLCWGILLTQYLEDEKQKGEVNDNSSYFAERRQIMSKVLLQLVYALVAAMKAMLTPEVVKGVIDRAFDYVEDKVAASETKIDDYTILPLLQGLRTALSIPDNDKPVADAETTE